METPLRYRLPNPPPVFVGREREMGALAAITRRGPVALLCGPGGIGKTALALALCPQLPTFAFERALLIELRPGEPVEDPRLRITRVLARCLGIERVDWTDVLHDDDSIGGALIDLAETGGFCVVLDDLHHLDEPRAVALLRLLARYARRSRWIVTSRAPPTEDALTAQTVTLDGLDEGALTQLARALVPDLSEADLRGAVTAAAGSPWSLQQQLASPGVGDANRRLLGLVPDGAMALLETLASVDAPLPLEALRSLTPPPPEDVIRALERRGLVQRAYGRYRLHDVVRRTLRASPAGGRAIASSLELDPPRPAPQDPEALLDDVHAMLRGGAIDDARTGLDARGAHLVDAGFAPRLWQLLELSLDPRLAPWKLRCAVSLGQVDLIARCDPPHEADLEGRLIWARGLLLRREPEAALALAEGLRAHDSLRVRAGLLAAECLSVGRRYDEASAVLDALEPRDASARVLRAAWTAYCLASLGRAGEAARHLGAVDLGASAVSPEVRNQSRLIVAMVMSLIGRPIDAYEASKAVLSASLRSVKCLSVHFINSLNVGRLVEAGELLDRLARFLPERSPLRPFYEARAALYHGLVGELVAVDATLARWKPELRRRGDLRALGSLLQVEIHHRMCRAEPRAPLSGEEDLQMQGGPQSRWNALLALRWENRAGADIVSPSDARGDAPTLAADSELSATCFMERLITVEALLLRGETGAALHLSELALGDARRCGWVIDEANLLPVRCDLLVVSGRWSELAATAREFEALALALPSPRLQHEASFYAAFSPPGPVAWGLLEELARRVDCAPTAARRARALLGDAAPLDAIDRAVLAALRSHRGVAPAELLGSAPADARHRTADTWGMDDAARRVWRAGAEGVSLAERPLLWRLLVALYDRGGRATKEELVRDLWSEPEYHPLRHDNRLQASVRKARIALESDASRPARLVTTADGYALIGPLRRARVPG